MLRLLGEKFTGISMMVITALLFSVMALFVRLASQTMPVGMIIFTRYVLSTLFIALLWRAGVISVRPVNRRLLMMRAVAASFGAIFYFSAVSSITMGEAVILKYTYPFFAVTFAAVLYGEKTDRSVIGLIVMSVAGVVIMMNPSSFNPQIGYLWGLMTGLSAGAAVAFVRKLRDTDDSGTIMFFTSFVGMFISMPFLASGVVVPDGHGLAFLLLAATCGIAAQFALVYGIRYIKTGSACVIMALEVALSAGLGFVVLGHTLGPAKIIGGAMVLTGGGILILRESARAASESKKPAEAEK